ncbi:MAG: zinc-dependent metalloprotease [Bacteroidia bacterium]|nr:zinc-dependent metalloprotease [Bacteroidia bacterium]NNJ56824.1 T9SS type A sorting domain-containing protein [Bacteroidia bacterium]
MRGVLLFIIGFTVSFLYAQTEQCGQVEYMDYLETLSPGIKEQADNMYFESLRQSQARNKWDAKDTLYTINVVFHVMYNIGEENLTDEVIKSQMDILNASYRRTNEDTVLTRDIFKPVAADVGIQFQLAKVDPNGDSTSGIVRKYTPRSSYVTSQRFATLQAEQVKTAANGSAAWDTEKYLNIWVCDLSYLGYDLLLGFAYPPTSAPNWPSTSYVNADRQGVVVHYKTVGENSFTTLTSNKTLVHEVGHYLGLRHIWGDAPANDRCNHNYDDFINDTPLAGSSSDAPGCNYNKNTCDPLEPDDLPDQIENYMDYSPGTCQNMFTSDQAGLMRQNLITYRPGIIALKTYEMGPEPMPYIPPTETRVYPNPASTFVVVEIKDPIKENRYKLKITNVLGQPVFEKELESESRQRIEYNFGLSGFYIYQIFENEDVMVEDRMLFGQF